MKSLTLILALVATSAQPATIETDRRELVQLAERMDYAWTSGDPDANAALFASDATAKFGTDPLSEGRGAIRAQFQEFFQDRPAGLRHVTRIERVERLTPDLALWDAEVRSKDGRPPADG